MKRKIIGIVGIMFTMWEIRDSLKVFNEMKSNPMPNLIPTPDDWLRGKLLKWVILLFSSFAIFIWGWFRRDPFRNNKYA